MRQLQKGFSLVELLVVVAIIGVLAGVGIVGYQSYTDSAKSRVAIANYNSVKRFIETELTLLPLFLAREWSTATLSPLKAPDKRER